MILGITKTVSGSPFAGFLTSENSLDQEVLANGKSDERSLSSSKYDLSDYTWFYSIHRRSDPDFGIQSKR